MAAALLLTLAHVQPLTRSRIRIRSRLRLPPLRKQNAAPVTKSQHAATAPPQIDSPPALTSRSQIPPPRKGEWGLLIADAATGETLFALNDDKYFVPASNMKLFSTALALSKLGLDYKFHTTLETRGTISEDGTLSSDLVLVGRGDPNLSNRKFPFDLKEEFDGPPEKVLAELADELVAKGVKQIKGDVVGDDSYFPREPYPDGWEIGDMVWEYGAAISAIVLDDNTATLTLTPGLLAGDAVKAEIAPATPDFYVENDVVTSAAEVKSDLTLTREPGAQLVVVRGTLPANSAPRKLILAVHEPALHAAAVLKNCSPIAASKSPAIRAPSTSPKFLPTQRRAPSSPNTFRSRSAIP